MMGFIRESLRDLISDSFSLGRKEVVKAFYGLKKRLFIAGIELAAFLTGIVFIFVAIVLMLSRIFSIDYVLLVSGLVLVSAVLLIARFK